VTDQLQPPANVRSGSEKKRVATREVRLQLQVKLVILEEEV